MFWRVFWRVLPLGEYDDRQARSSRLQFGISSLVLDLWIGVPGGLRNLAVDFLYWEACVHHRIDRSLVQESGLDAIETIIPCASAPESLAARNKSPMCTIDHPFRLVFVSVPKLVDT